MGDSIMGLSAVSYFRLLYPKATIIYGLPQWICGLYRDVDTDADEIFPVDLGSFGGILDLYEFLLNAQVTIIHELHQTGSGKKVLSLFASLKGIKYTYHNHHKKYFQSEVIQHGEPLPLIQRDLDGVYSFYAREQSRPNYLDFSPTMKMKVSENKQVHSTPPKNKIIFGVVATRPTKIWPIESFISLALLIENKFSNVEILIPLSKNSFDQALKNKIQNEKNLKHVQIIEKPLDELPQVLSGATLYIGNDTGLKHLAIALGTTTYTLFGPEPILEWHPYDVFEHPVFYREQLACRTRQAHYCGLYECDLFDREYLYCLKSFSPEYVFQELGKVLSNTV